MRLSQTIFPVHHPIRAVEILLFCSAFMVAGLYYILYRRLFSPEPCQALNRTMGLQNSLLHSTLVRRLAASRTVFSNKAKFLRFMGSRGKLFYCSALTGLRFPAQAPVNGDAKVPSLLYYDQSGDVRAAGAEVLTEGVIETALIEEWTKAEWLVVDDVSRTHTHP